MAKRIVSYCLHCGIVLDDWRRKFCCAECQFFACIRIGDPAECWIWVGYCDPSGYGRVSSTFVKEGYPRYAHGLAWVMFIGPIPAGKQLDHRKCRRKSCVNPFHLEPCTRAENCAQPDGAVGIQLARTVCKRGHPYEGENLRISRRGHRVCRTCERDRWAAKSLKGRTSLLYCKRGHPLFGSNMRLGPDRRSRACKTCRRENTRAFRDRRAREIGHGNKRDLFELDKRRH